MTLATHAIIAGATARTIGISNPALGLVVGTITHYLIDAIPHCDYEPRIIKKNPENPMEVTVDLSPGYLTLDGTVIGLDALTGTTALYLLWNAPPLLILMTALGGILPDALQMVYGLYKKWPLTRTQRVHDFFHARLRLSFTPTAFFSQAGLIALGLWALI